LQSQAAGTLAGLDASIEKAHTFDTPAVAFEPDPKRKRLWMSGADGRVRRWDAATDTTETFGPAGVGPFAFRPDGATWQLIRGEDKRSVELRDVTAARPVRAFRTPGGPPIGDNNYAVTPDGSHVAALCRSEDAEGQPVDDGAAFVWEAGSGRL